MRVVPVVVGCLLLAVGAGAVVIADQQREQAVEQAQQEVERVQERLSVARETNLDLAEVLTGLRVDIADQEELLADTDGFLE